MSEHSQPLAPGSGEVMVRMYRHGLGDCYLLAFGRATGSAPFRLLIDCGVHRRQKDGGERLAEVQKDIVAASGGHLNAMVITHEHADHLSGLTQKGSAFLDGSLSVDQAWLAWTERPGEALADRLRRRRQESEAVLEAALERLRERERSETATSRLAAERRMRLRQVESQLDFTLPSDESHDEAQRSVVAQRLRECKETLPVGLEPNDARPVLGARARRRRGVPWNQAAIALLRGSAKEVRYWEPGEVIEPDRVPDCRLYVLGPPRDERLLKKDAPSRARGAAPGVYRETYLAAGGSPLAASAGLNGVGERLEPHERSPFADQGVVAAPLGELADETARAPLPEATRAIVDAYLEQSWRAIDDDWLDEAGALALSMDGDTNNTSLVLAVELGAPGSGDILLFPGDAQVGNWLSWRDRRYAHGASRQSVDEMLARTRLYKVAHHGSHNGTLRADARTVSEGEPYGLELMDDIIALINVDRAAADRPMPHVWHMPHLPLYETLRRKAARRVLRSDDDRAPLGEHTPPDIVPTSSRWTAVPGMPRVRWRRADEPFGTPPVSSRYFDLHFRRPETG